jgi:hypothetical protein
MCGADLSDLDEERLDERKCRAGKKIDQDKGQDERGVEKT